MGKVNGNGFFLIRQGATVRNIFWATGAELNSPRPVARFADYEALVTGIEAGSLAITSEVYPGVAFAAEKVAPVKASLRTMDIPVFAAAHPLHWQMVRRCGLIRLATRYFTEGHVTEPVYARAVQFMYQNGVTNDNLIKRMIRDMVQNNHINKREAEQLRRFVLG